MKLRSLLFSALVCLCFLTGPASAADLPGTVVLTNENGLIDNLIARGYGSNNLWQILVVLASGSGGAISESLMETLTNNPPGSEIFTAKLEYFAGLNNPVCLNIDGTLGIQPIYGRNYYGQSGYSTYPPGLRPQGEDIYTTANTPAQYINAGERQDLPSGVYSRYLATLIIWGSPCTYALSTSTGTFGASGDAGSFTVTPSESACSWTAASNDAWINVTAGASGAGTGTVSYSVDANTDAGSRTGTITIAGETFTVTQSGTAPVCTYSLSSTADSVGSAAASGSVTVTASDGSCTWTAASNATWIDVTAGAAGAGTGTVSYSVAANTGTISRTGTITIAGETFTIAQSGTSPICTYTLSSTAESVGSAAALGSLAVTASDGSCAWTAVSNASWLDVTAGSSGTGTGTVSYSIAVNNSLAPRTGTITIAGQTFTITQSGALPACTYTLSPSAVSLDASSAQGSLTVTPSTGTCAWTAASSALWITVTAGSSGTGTGTVSYSAAANTAPDSRTGTLTVGGLTFTIIQSGTAPSLDTVQKAYIGYYQRPADPAGLIWWADYLATHGGSLAAIIEAFANSDESKALYGEINSGNIASVIDAIYQALFNRQADTAGRDWYVAEFNKGSFTAATIMLNVLYGAQNDDLVTLNNKLIAANLFTKTIDPELDSSSFQATYAGDTDANAARAFLGLVSATASTVPTQSEITEYIKSYIADPGDAILTP